MGFSIKVIWLQGFDVFSGRLGFWRVLRLIVQGLRLWVKDQGWGARFDLGVITPLGWEPAPAAGGCPLVEQASLGNRACSGLPFRVLLRT